jgi:hypothetical protein
MVTEATGQQGGAVARHMLETGLGVRVHVDDYLLIMSSSLYSNSPIMPITTLTELLLGVGKPL